ncbi:MAG TPA: hypothetical protein VG892_14335 [Terriglobales bacterium]|nr:hypothetical protein [Terriglobales bacterium]
MYYNKQKLAFIVTGRFLAVVVLALLLLWPASGSTVAFEFESAPTATDNPLSLGFQFTTNVIMTVSRLGYYDDGGDGLLTSHQVGIFDAGGNLVVSATVSAGTADPLVGHFRYVDITPTVLWAISRYTIAATSGGPSDPWAYGSSATISGLTFDPAINVAPTAGRFIYQDDEALHYPTDSFTYMVYAGPSFELDLIPLPEPGTFVLLGSVFLVCLLSRSRRFRRLASH